MLRHGVMTANGKQKVKMLWVTLLNIIRKQGIIQWLSYTTLSTSTQRIKRSENKHKGDGEMLQKHTNVMIYEDPVTCQKPEGKACLLHKVDDLGDGMERWKVCFAGEDGEVYERTIQSDTPIIS